MATDNFAATNNPLASPWQAVTNWGAMESATGVAFCATHDVLSAMVYSTSSVQEAQCKIVARVAGFAGPCLLNPSNGNGYYVTTNSGGTNVIIAKRTGASFDGDNTVAFATSVGDTLKLYFSGGNVICAVNGTDRNTWAESTYRSGLLSGVSGENEGDTLDDWTDNDAGGATYNAAPLLEYYQQLRQRGVFH